MLWKQDTLNVWTQLLTSADTDTITDLSWYRHNYWPQLIQTNAHELERRSSSRGSTYRLVSRRPLPHADSARTSWATDGWRGRPCAPVSTTIHTHWSWMRCFGSPWSLQTMPRRRRKTQDDRSFHNHPATLRGLRNSVVSRNGEAEGTGSLDWSILLDSFLHLCSKNVFGSWLCGLHSVNDEQTYRLKKRLIRLFPTTLYQPLYLFDISRQQSKSESLEARSMSPEIRLAFAKQ
jgi:hypothetical protein